MKVSNSFKMTTVAVWLLVVPLGFYFLFKNYPLEFFDWKFMVGYYLLSILSTTLTLNVSGTTLMLVQWISLAVFLKYGILAEAILIQVAMISLYIQLKLFSKEEYYRVFFNSFMFFTVSLISGLFVYAIGYDFDQMTVGYVLFYGIIYQVVNMTVNNVLLYFYQKLRKIPKISFFMKDTIWDYTSMFLTFPFGIILLLLDEHIGIIGFTLLGIPFVATLLLIRLYNNADKINIDLSKASQIGYQLADRLMVKEVMEVFIKHLDEMFASDYTYIVDIAANGEMYILYAYESGMHVRPDVNSHTLTNSFLRKVAEYNKSRKYNNRIEWKHFNSDFLPEDVQSIIATPITRNQRLEGILVLASTKRSAFESYQLRIIELLGSYFAVAIEKARYVEDAISKSERCGLTKLYNYRYLDAYIEREMKNLQDGLLHHLSIIMLDIDHFKSVNDNYGHQSGNDILFQLAHLLEKVVGDIGVIARYGGEEFVVLIPNYTKQQALQLAEQIRREIESNEFLIVPDLQDIKEQIVVHITSSIGVSTIPEDTDDGMTLIRNADRALYIGAKRAGRNRVAQYEK